MKRILVTGAAGFIGSAFVRMTLGLYSDYSIRALVRSTGTTDFNDRLSAKPELRNRFEVIQGDLTKDVSGCCEGMDYVVHFAAKTFVDHSIRDPQPFVDVNVGGTLRILEDARKCKVKKVICVGTDEVYGQILHGAYKEDAPLNPRNPYAASKAAADGLAVSYAHTYGLHTLVTRTENNYGPYQNRQKALPTFFRHAFNGEPLPVYGDGNHVRQWLWVYDHVEALLLLLKADTKPGDVYHVAGSQEVTNFELACKVIQLAHYDKQPEPDWPKRHIRFVPDHDIRPGHDRRYALDSSKLRALGWAPQNDLDTGLFKLLEFYRQAPAWLR